MNTTLTRMRFSSLHISAPPPTLLTFLVVVVVVIVDVGAGFGEFPGEELPALRWPAFFFGAFAVGVE